MLIIKYGIENQCYIVGAVMLKKPGLALAEEKAEMATLYRSVSPAELTDIIQNGLRTNPNSGYALEKLFTTSAKDASFFSKSFYPWDKTANTIIKAEIPNNVMKQAGRFEMDGIQAIAIPSSFLQDIKLVTPLNYSPIP